MKNNKGVASILIVFVLGMVALFIGVSLLKTSFADNIISRQRVESNSAFYLANAGIEEAIYQLSLTSGNFGFPNPESLNLSLGEGNIKVTVSGSADERNIVSVGEENGFIRKINVTVQNTTLKPGFANAIHAGAGGIELRNQTLVTSIDGSGGNIYSNSFVKGAKNDFTVLTGECKNAASIVDGSVWAHKEVDKLSNNDSGICVVGEIHANDLNYCFAKTNLFSPNIPSPSCTTFGNYTNDPAPEIIPLPNMGVDNLKSYLNNKGITFSGNCIADGSNNSTDCTFGTLELGNIVITGDLNKPSNVNLKIKGPVWVKGDILFDSLGSIKPRSDITEISQIIVSDGVIRSESNVAYGKNVNAYLLVISTYNPEAPSQDLVCNDIYTPAIIINSNSESVLFYAMNGCIKVNANSQFYGALLGEGIRIDNNSNVEYDPDLQTALFGLTKDGGWKIVSYIDN